MNFEKYKQEIHQNARDKGFWDAEENIEEKFMLIVSELAEAMEADRKGKYADKKHFLQEFDENDGNQLFNSYFTQYIKDSFEDEIADTVIRLLDFAGGHKIDIRMVDEEITQLRATSEMLFDLTKKIIKLAAAFIENDWYRDALFAETISMFEAFCKSKNIDLEWHIQMKMRYNSSRPRLHGKKY